MANWRFNVSIKILDPEKPIVETRTAILTALQVVPKPMRAGLDWDTWIEMGEEAIDIDARDSAHAHDAAIDVFDDALSYLYDWADANRIWLGP